ncbi:hypothetical protein [Nannocystis radixulma]|uniref:Uncharacterized protein n=1 Tax=Nannocystis radixulma TaxID=2995305 RepID=A0ABT5B1E8_9BACT|nr:hypothetical protein [Nannocystis radixulma]MDC0667925.1 hypothetical protein [Nannocystis radixulma]
MTTYKKMKCFNLMTGEFVGYLGTHDNYVTVTDANGAANLVWASSGADLYLEKDTTPNDRYLGLADQDYAGWGLKGGWRNPVLFNSDGSISLKDDPRRKLYGPVSKITANYVAFTEAGDNNQNILRFEMES